MITETAHIRRASNPLREIIGEDLVNCDFDNILEVQDSVTNVLKSLADNLPRVVDTIDYIREVKDLREKCESDGHLNKVILYRDPGDRFSIRLHSLEPYPDERPHNHRATFGTLILMGNYNHSLYEAPEVIHDQTSDIELTSEHIRQMRCVLQRVDDPGSSYILHHSALHSTSHEGQHLSIVIRGPSVRRRLLFIDSMDLDRPIWHWHYGSREETEEELMEKRMSDSYLDRVQLMLARI